MGVGTAWADTLVETLDLTDESVGSSNYTNTFNWNNNWSLSYAANNSKKWPYMRFGGKASTSGTAKSGTSTITSRVSFDKAIDYLVIEHLGINGKKPEDFSVTSIVLETSSTSDFSKTSTTTIDDADLSSSTTTKTLTITPSTQVAADSYYRISINWATTNTNNMGLDIEKVKLYQSAPSTPSISTSDVDIAYSATSGSIAYTVNNSVEGGTVSASVTAGNEGNWLSVGSPSNGSVALTCSANSAYTERTATVTLTYTYNTTETVTEDVTVTQAAAPIPTHTLSVSASNGSVEITGKTLVNGACEVAEGASVTATATPAEHYTFTNWTAPGVTLDNTANPVTFTMPSGNVTLTANFTEDAKHTATFYVLGVEVDTDEDVYEGEAITFPTSVTAPAGFTFMGWTKTEISGSQATAPADLVTAANTNMGNANVNYYAVFAVATINGEDTYEQLTSNAFDADATYVIAGKQSSTVNTMYYLVSYENTNADSNWGVATTTPATNTPVKFTLSGTASALVAKDNSGNYLTCITVKKFAMSSTSTTVYLAADGAIKSASDGNYLRYNYNTGNGGYRWYAGTITGTQAYFYKVVPGITYSTYCTTPSVSITVGASKFTSTYYSTLPLVVPTGLTAYTFKVNASNKLDISQTINAGQTIAKDQAVIIYGNAGTYDFNITGTDSTKDANNVLRGFDVASTTTGGNIYYRLTTKGNDASTIGFYWGAENGGAFTVGAHKAYVAVGAQLDFGAGARMADIFGFDEANGIDNVNGETITNNRYFDLQGRQVTQPTKGLYIVNGKKMLVK